MSFRQVMRLAVPPRLRRGDRVALLAPCSPQPAGEESLIEEACGHLERWGLRVLRQEDGYKSSWHYLAGSDADRARRFEEAYLRDDIKAIFLTRGGYGSARLAARLDSRRFMGRHKIVVGFSDATFLLHWLQRASRMVVYHGPGVATRQFSSARNRAYLRRVLFGDSSLPAALPCRPWLRPRATAGVLTGGCLSLLVTTLGTSAEIETRGRLLFIEDVNEQPFRVDRMLTHLRLAGKFAGLRGLVFGEMKGCEGARGELWEILADFFKDDDFPVARGLPCGHGQVNRTLPLGLGACLEFSKGHGRLRFRQA